MKAIETVYNGYRFRSRLEARWAVFFDTLGIPWEYEVEGFEIEGIRYLPDFWLPQQECWIEVKGQELTPQEMNKCLLFSRNKDRNTNFFITIGSIPLPVNDQDIVANYFFPTSNGLVGGYHWTECPLCRAVNIVFQGDVERVCDCFSKYLNPSIKRMEAIMDEREDIGMSNFFHAKLGDFLRWTYTFRLANAYAAARQARFEYGERGR